MIQNISWNLILDLVGAPLVHPMCKTGHFNLFAPAFEQIFWLLFMDSRFQSSIESSLNYTDLNIQNAGPC